MAVRAPRCRDDNDDCGVVKMEHTHTPDLKLVHDSLSDVICVARDPRAAEAELAARVKSHMEIINSEIMDAGLAIANALGEVS